MNYHKQLKTLIAELDRDQHAENFEWARIEVFDDHVRFHWDAIEDSVEIDVGVLANTAGGLGMRAVIWQSDGLNVLLYPIGADGGAA